MAGRRLKAWLFRCETSAQGTFGYLALNGHVWHLLELPWRGNAPNISCIPTGTYIVKIRKSPKYGDIYHITDVDGRSWVLCHSGNLAGDTEQGWKTHSQGCLLIGKKRGRLAGQKAVLNSRTALREFMNIADGREIELRIMGAEYV